jgi:hypothetical protein
MITTPNATHTHSHCLRLLSAIFLPFPFFSFFGGKKQPNQHSRKNSSDLINMAHLLALLLTLIPSIRQVSAGSFDTEGAALVSPQNCSSRNCTLSLGVVQYNGPTAQFSTRGYNGDDISLIFKKILYCSFVFHQ